MVEEHRREVGGFVKRVRGRISIGTHGAMLPALIAEPTNTE